LYTLVCENDTPVLLEMPHSGSTGIGYENHRATDGLPKVLAQLVRFDSEAVRRTIGAGCDAAVPQMTGYKQLCNDGLASGIRMELARVFMDCNRARNAVSGLAVQGAPLDRDVHGVIWSQTMLLPTDIRIDRQRLEEQVRREREPMLREPLTEADFEELLRLTYDAYHAGIREQHARIRAHHGICVHLALHSLPPFQVTMVDGGYVPGMPARRGRTEPGGETLPDVILIHDDFRAAQPRYVNAIRDVFTRAGLLVEDGTGPFLGDRGVTAEYGDPNRGIHVIGIEHVTHDGIEPERHLGGTAVDADKASAFRDAYREAVQVLRKL